MTEAELDRAELLRYFKYGLEGFYLCMILTGLCLFFVPLLAVVPAFFAGFCLMIWFVEDQIRGDWFDKGAVIK